MREFSVNNNRTMAPANCHFKNLYRRQRFTKKVLISLVINWHTEWNEKGEFISIKRDEKEVELKKYHIHRRSSLLMSVSEHSKNQNDKLLTSCYVNFKLIRWSLMQSIVGWFSHTITSFFKIFVRFYSCSDFFFILLLRSQSTSRFYRMRLNEKEKLI
jgi:hypothetical protein